MLPGTTLPLQTSQGSHKEDLTVRGIDRCGSQNDTGLLVCYLEYEEDRWMLKLKAVVTVSQENQEPHSRPSKGISGSQARTS